jgi:hypothetical protein
MSLVIYLMIPYLWVPYQGGGCEIQGYRSIDFGDSGHLGFFIV